jgi:hypothetical protein
MKRVQIAASVLAAAAFVAACAERDSVTAPSADAVALAPTGFIGDRPDTWQVTCSSHDLPFGTLGVDVGWVWLSGGVAIAGTSRSVVCHPDVASTLSGSDVRPAAADGFFAFVGWPTPNTKTWSFDPSGPFKVLLKGTSVQTICDMISCTQLKSSGTLKVES